MIENQIRDHAQALRGIGRRDLMAWAAGIGAASLSGRPALAAAKEFVLANWGGPSAEAMLKCWGEPFQSASGLKFAMDGSGPTNGRVRAMVEAGQAVWDVCDASIGAAFTLGDAGLLEPIDYTIIDKSLVRDGMAYKYAIANYIFSYCLTVDGRSFGDHQPTSWADMWNFKDFPGKRVLRASSIGQLEGALIADGVPKDKLYPIDVKRALDKIKEIREHAVFWKNGTQAADLFRNKEVVMGNVWHTTTLDLRRQLGPGIAYSWDAAVVAPAVWMVPKGNPAGVKAAMEFIKVALQPEGQKEFFTRRIGNSPSNPAASSLIPESLRADDPGQPENFNRQIQLDAVWYGKYLNDVEPQYLDIISS